MKKKTTTVPVPPPTSIAEGDGWIADYSYIEAIALGIETDCVKLGYMMEIIDDVLRALKREGHITIGKLK